MLARRRSRSRGALRRFFILSLVFLVLGGGAYLVWFSPVFDIQAVEVETESERLNLSFDDAVGQNIIFWRPNLNLQEDASRVAEVGVQKNYLTREVKVTVKERERYAIWCAEEQSECFWIDVEGVAFSPAPNLKGPVIFRLVRDFSERELKLGDKVLEENLMANLQRAFALLDELDVSVQEFSIESLKFREATAVTGGGPQIYFSLQDDPWFGKTVVESLRQSGEWEVISYVNLRVPGRAYYSQ